MNFLDLIFPVNCLECGKSGKYICDLCLSKVEVLNRFDGVNKTLSIFAYTGVIKKAITKIKYNFAFDIAKELATVSAQNLKSPYIKFDKQNTVLVPIPLHESRVRWRGFNQSEILGKLIAEKLNWKFEDLLIRPIEGKNQVGLPKSDRVRNIRGKFAVNSTHENKIEPNKTYIIFDDVATTGSTIKEGISVIKKVTNHEVIGLTIAR
jgi:competence protein ComFC